jgi:hypothetical protein
MKWIGGNLSFANVAAGLALLFSMSGGAIAATGGFSTGGTLKACANEEGVIRLLKPGKSCRKGQKPVSWNQTGPTGVKGATGATGAAGAIGATGAAGTSGPEGIPASTAWARVGPTAAVEAGHGVVSVTHAGSGSYRVKFDHDIGGCGSVATENDGPGGTFVSYTYTEGSELIVVITDGSGAMQHDEHFTAIAVC